MRGPGGWPFGNDRPVLPDPGLPEGTGRQGQRDGVFVPGLEPLGERGFFCGAAFGAGPLGVFPDPPRGGVPAFRAAPELLGRFLAEGLKVGFETKAEA